MLSAELPEQLKTQHPALKTIKFDLSRARALIGYAPQNRVEDVLAEE